MLLGTRNHRRPAQLLCVFWVFAAFTGEYNVFTIILYIAWLTVARLSKMGTRLPRLVREECGLDDSRLVQPSCQYSPQRRPDGIDVAAVGADVQAEREEGLRNGSRASSPAVAARLRGASRGRRPDTNAALGSLSSSLLPGTCTVRATASSSPGRKTSLILPAVNSI